MNVNVISETKQEFNGVTYYLCGYYFQHKGKRLHREVWKYHKGEIPKGYHVHHIDNDRSNNNIDNLDLKSKVKHLKDHCKEESRIEYGKMHIERIRPKAIEWHKSEAGKEVHSRLGKENYRKREYKTYICTQCGSEFKTQNIYSENENTFCSNKCKSQFRRLSGVDDIEKICVYCGKTFIANKYARPKCCSKECSTKKRWGK